jgi:hypothetical protein
VYWAADNMDGPVCDKFVPNDTTRGFGDEDGAGNV